MASKYIAYVGTSDRRELSKKDLADAGVESQGKLSVSRGEVVELDEKVATFILEHPSLKGEFKEVEEGEELRLSAVRGVSSSTGIVSDASSVGVNAPTTSTAGTTGASKATGRGRGRT